MENSSLPCVPETTVIQRLRHRKITCESKKGLREREDMYEITQQRLVETRSNLKPYPNDRGP